MTIIEKLEKILDPKEGNIYTDDYGIDWIRTEYIEDIIEGAKFDSKI